MEQVVVKTVRVIIVSCLVFVLVWAAAYELAAPAVVAGRYINRVQASARSLESSYKDLESSTDFALINEPDAPPAAQAADAARIKRLVRQSRKDLASFKQTRESLRILPYTRYSPAYGRAFILKERSGWIVNQTDEALSNYLALASYLQAYYQTRNAISAELAKFNEVTDLNVYAGRSKDARAVAARIRGSIRQLPEHAPLSDLDHLHQASLRAFNQAAGGFDSLAHGVNPVVYARIDAAALQLEQATKDIEALSATSYGKSIRQSRAVKDITDLKEKLDLILS